MQTTKPTKPKQKNKPSKPSPEDISGKQRVIIKNVLPQVDQNRFPVKRTLGESVEVTADMFADARDKIQP